tara:strand:- start:1047 stop:1877 length:831 start_codon:yes stop_codon:yes gene_type:complete
MIPFEKYTNNGNTKCSFIHGNGFPPLTYKSLLTELSNKLDITSMLLRPHWEKITSPYKLKNWRLFVDDFIQHANEQKIKNSFGIGHSIGGNIILKAAIKNHEIFKSIVLLDPTIFAPSIIYTWKVLSLFPKVLENFPLAKAARNRKISYLSKEEIFISYRKKNIFRNIQDKQLNEYIDSIFEEYQSRYELNFSKVWEEHIFLKSVYDDMYVWRNLYKIKIPVLIIKPDSNPVFRLNAVRKISKNKNFKVVTLTNSSHLFPLEKYKETTDIISDFLF